MNARRSALSIVCAVLASRALLAALSDSNPLESFLDELYSVDPMFRLDERALDEAKDAGKPVAKEDLLHERAGKA